MIKKQKYEYHWIQIERKKCGVSNIKTISKGEVPKDEFSWIHKNEKFNRYK